VLTSTNHGSASELIWLPVVEITSAASSAASGRQDGGAVLDPAN
jgi:hypothetical protein